MKAKWVLLILGMNLLHLDLSAQVNEQLKIDSLLVQLNNAKDDTNKVNLYIALLNVHVYYKNEEGLYYEKPALDLAKKLKFEVGVIQLKMYVGRIYWRLGIFDEALKRHFEALRLLQNTKKLKLIESCLQFIGQDYADGGQYTQAITYFNKSLRLAKARGDKRSIAGNYMLLSWVHNNLGNYTEAIKLNYLILKLSEETGHKYDIGIAISNIAEDHFILGNYEKALNYYRRALKIILENDDKINAAGCYINVGDIYKIKNNYPEAIKNYSNALQLIDNLKDPYIVAKANGGIGNIHQAQKNFSLALQYYSRGAESFKSIQNKQELSLLYCDMGICFAQLRQHSKANKCFEDALTLSKELNSNISFTSYFHGKMFLDSAMGNWKSAYNNYKQYVHLKESTFNKDNLKKMLSYQATYESEKKEAAEKAEREKQALIAKAKQEKKDILQRTIRNSIIAVLIGSLVFLTVVYRQRNKIAKARKRSDELLLNILPEEVAEELKNKGSADAKQFDEVTVMFTDFKGFTKISERLTPAELVNEIHTCFKEFDHIIAKHNIEKIKTIGDAYMCAGGLPVANISHAKDVVNAALEIQKFMLYHFQQRKNEGKEIFEIRIGIHTGPVVAGIVGVKKFAYDIWGDTVNTASRMETSGEAGKVNISGQTYELVKDDFQCIHRGKIQAKNKGEIDMYFVDNIS